MKKTILILLFLLSFNYAEPTKIDMHGQISKAEAKIFYAKVLSIQQVMGYKYLQVDENGKKIWIAIANAPVEVGQKIGYDKRTILKNFRSKSLNKTFKEIVFASEVYLVNKPKKIKNLRDMLGLNNSTTPTKNSEEKPSKPFVKKEFYSVDEIHMWRKSLNHKIIKVKGFIYKVSHQIMKRDWVHLGDGSGDEKKLTDDLVFTAQNTSLKANDKVIAMGKVVIDKDFGYGYFYKVLIENASFKKQK